MSSMEHVDKKQREQIEIKGHDRVLNLKGIKYERSVILYMRNISVCVNETEQSITVKVKSYVKRKD